MKTRIVAVSLKIPDNQAYTALTTLRRLGVDVARLERAEIWHLRDAGDDANFRERVQANEAIFNPNKHELALLEDSRPRAGEVWIEDIDAREEQPRIAEVSAGKRCVGWRLFAQVHEPADSATVRAAVERLLCNPAIERAIY